MLSDIVTFIFFMAQIVIFFAKVLNVMSFKIVDGEPTLKMYGVQFSLIFIMVSAISWVIMFAAFSAVSVDSSFFWNNGIPSAAYVEYNLYFQLTSFMMVVTFFLTIIEIWIFLNDSWKSKTEKGRRKSYTERGLKLPPWNPYKQN